MPPYYVRKNKKMSPATAIHFAENSGESLVRVTLAEWCADRPKRGGPAIPEQKHLEIDVIPRLLDTLFASTFLGSLTCQRSLFG